MTTEVSSERKHLERIVVLTLALLTSAVFLWMIRAYLKTIFLAAVLALLLQELQDKLAAALGERPRFAAFLLVVGSVRHKMVEMVQSLLGVVPDDDWGCSSFGVPRGCDHLG